MNKFKSDFNKLVDTTSIQLPNSIKTQQRRHFKIWKHLEATMPDSSKLSNCLREIEEKSPGFEPGAGFISALISASTSDENSRLTRTQR